MGRQYGKLIRTDEQDIQNSYEDAELLEYISSKGSNRAERLVNDVTSAFMNNAQLRGNLFFDLHFLPYANSSMKDIRFRMPVFGIKGKHASKSISNYAHWYISEEAELGGKSFFQQIFGTEFVSEEEFRKAERPDELLRAAAHPVDMGIRAKDRQLIFHITEKLWAALEQDVTARFVIVLPAVRSKEPDGQNCHEVTAPEDMSMEILRQVYLLIPQKLRFTIGFATCVTPAEMRNLTEDKNLAVHVFTTDSTSDLDTLEEARYPHVIFRIDEHEKYDYDPQKINVLEELYGYSDSEGTLERLLDYAEKKSVGQDDVLSFGEYGKIAEYALRPWYKKGESQDLLGALKCREEYDELLTCSKLEKRWKSEFLGEVLPNGDYAAQLVHLIYDPDIKDLDGVMRKLSEKLGLGYLIDTVKDAAAVSDEKADRLESELKERKARCEELMLEKEALEMETQNLHAALADSEENGHRLEEQLKETEADGVALQNQNAELQVVIRSLEEEAEKVRANNSKLEELISELESENRRTTAERERLAEKSRKLEEERKGWKASLRKEQNQSRKTRVRKKSLWQVKKKGK